ncbi:hypothetical protein [Tessaracoccus oleiagri]|nr:hypothetical protein [Tessaracoccus oleiagri]
MSTRGLGGWRRRPAPRGMVTIELAVGIVTATLLAAGLVTLVLLGVAQAAVAESSAQIARQIARGDEAALAVAERRSPRESTVVHRDGGVEVTVEARSFVLGIGDVPVRASAWAAYEPGVGP